VIDDDRCKMVVMGTEAVAGYTGLANLERATPTHFWLAETLQAFPRADVRAKLDIHRGHSARRRCTTC
jgi:hypothetical protein